jgi:hypothetical protein
MTLYDDLNERLDLRMSTDVVSELRPELSSFLRSVGLGHLLEEVFLPLSASSRTKAAVAIEERPWPPAGVGARSIRGLALAALSDDGQSLLTPVMLSAQHETNVGLGSALTKLLLEDLADDGIEWASIFVSRGSKVVANELSRTGFAPRGARVLSNGVEFVAFSASPRDVLTALELADVRVADVLALNLEPEKVSRLTAFQLGLRAGVLNHWAERTRWAEVFPGLIDWAALPPGGITGTPGPGGDDFDPVIIFGN